MLAASETKLLQLVCSRNCFFYSHSHTNASQCPRNFATCNQSLSTDRCSTTQCFPNSCSLISKQHSVVGTLFLRAYCEEVLIKPYTYWSTDCCCRVSRAIRMSWAGVSWPRYRLGGGRYFEWVRDFRKSNQPTNTHTVCNTLWSWYVCVIRRP